MEIKDIPKIEKWNPSPSRITRGKNILYYLDQLIFSSKEINIKDTILISSAPRSGSTWLMEILGTIPGYTYIFEPLNPTWFPESFEVGFKSRTYLPSNTEWIEGEKYLRKAFMGNIFGIPLQNSQIITHTPRNKLEVFMHRLLGNKLIVKSINFNRLLPWVCKRFQLRKIYFMIRHPCATIASQLNTGLCGYHANSPPYQYIFPTREDILNEASTIDKLDVELLKKLKEIRTLEEILAAAWCLDNFIPLSLSKPYPWTLIIYEKLIKEGSREIPNLFNELGEKITRSAFRCLKLPSMTTPWDQLHIVKDVDKQLMKWKQFLSEKQVERILNIVSDFGFNFYTENAEPDYGNINIL